MFRCRYSKAQSGKSPNSRFGEPAGCQLWQQFAGHAVKQYPAFSAEQTAKSYTRTFHHSSEVAAF